MPASKTTIELATYHDEAYGMRIDSGASAFVNGQEFKRAGHSSRYVWYGKDAVLKVAYYGGQNEREAEFLSLVSKTSDARHFPAFYDAGKYPLEGSDPVTWLLCERIKPLRHKRIAQRHWDTAAILAWRYRLDDVMNLASRENEQDALEAVADCGGSYRTARNWGVRYSVPVIYDCGFYQGHDWYSYSDDGINSVQDVFTRPRGVEPRTDTKDGK